MRELALRLLGPPELRVGGQRRAFRTKKALALVAYLALEPGPQPREKLAALLWPDADPEAGRASLRGTLVYVRDALSALRGRLDAGRLTLSLRVEPGECDAAALGQAAQAARVGRANPALLEEAAALWRGDLLDGFDLGEEGGFDAWLQDRRGAVRAAADLVFDRLSEAQLGRDPVGAAETARRWVTLDRLNETAWRRLMLARLGAGQPSLAREAFTACRQVLREELGAEPAPETLALEARLAESPAPLRPGGPPADLLPEDRLVGRSAEFGRLAEAYHRAARGQPGAVLLEGEPGIGKTRLASAFLAWACAQGAGALRGRAFEVGEHAPFGALTDALRRWLRREAQPRELLGLSWWRELSRLLPEVRDRVPDLLPAADDAGARARLLAAVAELVLALAGRAPLALLLDDLQWTDPNTLEALRYLAARLAEEQAPVLLVLTARSEGLSPTSSLAAWITDLGREVPLTRLGLGELSREETRQLLGGLAGEADEATLGKLAARLFAETGGHPLYLTETLKGLLERGALSVRGGRLWVDDARLERGREGVRAVIGSRLSRLPPAALALAQAGTILGEPAAFEELRRTADLGEEEGLTGLEDLLRAGLLREVPGETGRTRYLLSHDRVRETLDAALGSERRRVLHRRAALALEGLSPGQAARLARHWEQAGEGERAARSYGEAGAQAVRLAALPEALALLTRALSLTPATPAQFETRAELLHGMERVLLVMDAGGRGDVEAHWRRSAEQARKAGLYSEEAESLRALAEFLLARRGRREELARLLARALEVAQAGGEARDVGRVRTVSAFAALYHGDHEAARTGYEAALALSRAAGDEVWAGRALTELGWLAQQQGHWDAARAHLLEALPLARRMGKPDALTVLARLDIALGNYAAVDGWFREMLAAATRAGDEGLLNIARTLYGWSGQLRGDDAMAVRHLRPALEFARSHGLARFEANILGELGVSTARLGDHDAARAMYAQARAACEANEDVEVASATWGAVGDIATELGDLEGAESAYRHALRGRLADRALRGVAGLAGVKVSRGEWEEAALLLGALLSWNNVMHFLRVQAGRSLGRLREAVPPEELERLLECGHHLTFQEVVERWSA